MRHPHGGNLIPTHPRKQASAGEYKEAMATRYTGCSVYPRIPATPLSRARVPFSHPDWIFEIKWDGFRALLYSERDGVRLLSRNRNEFKSFLGLCEGLSRDLKGRRCVLDGEIVCLDSYGNPTFRNLLFRRAEPVFYAFDILWDEHAWSDDEEEMRRFQKGEDIRYLPLIDRKLRLRRVVPKRGERLVYCDHVERNGEGLFRLACENDLQSAGRSLPSRTG